MVVSEVIYKADVETENKAVAVVGDVGLGRPNGAGCVTRARGIRELDPDCGAVWHVPLDCPGQRWRPPPVAPKLCTGAYVTPTRRPETTKPNLGG